MEMSTRVYSEMALDGKTIGLSDAVFILQKVAKMR